MPWKMASYIPNFLKCFDFYNLSENLNVSSKSNLGWEVKPWDWRDKDEAVPLKPPKLHVVVKLAMLDEDFEP